MADGKWQMAEAARDSPEDAVCARQQALPVYLPGSGAALSVFCAGS